MFLLWPVMLACIMVTSYWANILSVLSYILIVCVTCLTTSMVALFCSVLFRKTAMSLMTTYSLILMLFCVPIATEYFAKSFFPQHEATQVIEMTGMASPIRTTFEVPLLVVDDFENIAPNLGPQWRYFAGYIGIALLLNGALFLCMLWMFNSRWRVSGSGNG